MLLTLDVQPAAREQVALYPAELYRGGHPHSAWRTLRREAPVRRETIADGGDFWSVTRYHDAVEVLRDTGRFSSCYSTMLTVRGDGDSARGKAIHLMDPPRHAAVRGSTIPALSMRVLREREDAIRERIGRMLDEGLADRECDFARLVTLLPMLVAGEVMNVPEKLWAEAAHWTVASMAPDDPHYAAGNTQMTLMQAHVFLLNMFSELIRECRKNPGADLVSLLCGMSIDGRPATDEDVLLNCYAFIMGAIPTTPQVASHLMMVIAEQPQLWQKARAQPEHLPALVEEALRWSSPVNHLLRRATEQVQLGGETIPEGGLVAVWLASANRDEEIFADPYVFDPARKPNPHLAFGTGAHRCVGNSAAQIGLRILVEELATRVAGVELVGPVRHLASNFLNGITSLPVRLLRH